MPQHISLPLEVDQWIITGLYGYCRTQHTISKTCNCALSLRELKKGTNKLGQLKQPAQAQASHL